MVHLVYGVGLVVGLLAKWARRRRVVDDAAARRIQEREARLWVIVGAGVYWLAVQARSLARSVLSFFSLFFFFS